MAKPDTRRRDRAEYMREYRARKAKERPSLQAQIDELRARVDAMTVQPGDRILAKGQPAYGHMEDGVYVADDFGRPRPAPKPRHPATRR